MTAKNQDFEMTEGDHHDVIFNITDGSGNAQDVSGWTFTWSAAVDVGWGNEITKSTAKAGEIDLTDPVNGEVTVRLIPTDTEGKAGELSHQLESLQNQRVTTEAMGQMKINGTNQ